MAKDHFVAQTYLKHFGDPNVGGMLHAYRKRDLTYFQCWPGDVCHEWNGDNNDAFLEYPELLGDYRRIFEPAWNPAVESISKGVLTNIEKFAIAGYMANLMIATPAWIRVAADIGKQLAISNLLDAKHSRPNLAEEDPLLFEVIKMIEAGELTPEVAPDFIKAKITKQVLAIAYIMYDQDWHIFRNHTQFPFLTSDNPVAIECSSQLGGTFTRFLAISPTTCIRIRFEPSNYEHKNIGDIAARTVRIRMPPKGIKCENISSAYAKHVNRVIVQSSESLVFSSNPSDKIRGLVSKYALFRVENEFLTFTLPNSADLYEGTSIRVRKNT
jgi:Protein of unknown function (DUF4238)